MKKVEVKINRKRKDVRIGNLHYLTCPNRLNQFPDVVFCDATKFIRPLNLFPPPHITNKSQVLTIRSMSPRGTEAS